jgi:hypothetical protein
MDVVGSSPIARSNFVHSVPAGGNVAESVFSLAMGLFVC